VNVYIITNDKNNATQALSTSLEKAIKDYKGGKIISITLASENIPFTEAEICTQ